MMKGGLIIKWNDVSHLVIQWLVTDVSIDVEYKSLQWTAGNLRYTKRAIDPRDSKAGVSRAQW
jgi:hypothetical protein